jgi:glycerol-3-phosphate dehydrogenase (NAD(P)+)
MTKQLPVLVIGAGAWGTALAMVLARKGIEVWLWGRNTQHMLQMQQQRQNQRFLPHQNFPATLHLATNLAEVVPRMQDIIIVVPSCGFRETLNRLVPYITNTTRICWATKGLEQQTGLLLHQVAEAVFDKRPLAVLSGPSFATEVAKALPTAVTIAAHVESYAQDLVNLFHTTYFRPYLSTDMIGVQLGGAIKNIIAIAAGIINGLGLGANTQAALITRGLAEMVRFGVALGGQRETFMGLAGLGDLVLTCTDDQSRNRRFGYALARGQSCQQAQADIQQIVEGVYATRVVVHLAEKMHIEMPITHHVNKVLQGLCTPQAAVDALLARELKQEIF